MANYGDWDSIVPEGHNSEMIAYIGNISFSEDLNEQEVSSMNGKRFKPTKIGKCKIEVYNGEGSIPHFHIFNKDQSFQCCVRIYENNFFSHGNKYKDTLNKNQCKELDEWLKMPNKSAKGRLTNWEAIEFTWNFANPNCKYPDKKKCTTQPDYASMTNFKDII
jgi:hypothetical protein